MSFEQQKNDDRDRERKKSLEQERSEAFWLEKQIYQESTDLLQKLALQISNDFGIGIGQAKELITETTWHSLDNFKEGLASTSEVNITDLENAINTARSSIEILSQKNREALKNSLEQEILNLEQHRYILSQKIFSPDTLVRIKNPKNIKDQVLWAGIWLFDSTEAVIFFTYKLGKWVIVTPYHIYLLLVGKAQYDGFSKI